MDAHFGKKDGRHDILQIPLADILEEMSDEERHDLLLTLAMDRELVEVLCHAVAGTYTDDGRSFADHTIQACRVAVAPIVGDEVAKGYKKAVEEIAGLKTLKGSLDMAIFDLKKENRNLYEQNQEIRQLNRILRERLDTYHNDKGADA